MSKLEEGTKAQPDTGKVTDGFSSLKVATPSVRELVTAHPYLEGVLTDKTKIAYNKEGDLVADCKNLQICLTDKPLPNAVMVNTNAAKPQIVVSRQAKLSGSQKEDAFNDGLAYACGGDYSKIG